MSRFPWHAALLALAAALLGAPAHPADDPGAEKIRVLVEFRRVPGPAERRLVEGLDAGVRHELPEVSTLALEIPPHRLAALRADPRIVSIEPDRERHILQRGGELVPAVDNGLYGLVTTRAINAHARGANGGGGIVCIADTGIDAHHPDIAPNYLGGVDTVDDDDDPDTGNRGGAPTHGTAVAAIAAGALNNIGVRGVAFGAGIIHARVLPDSGSGPESDIMAGVRRLVEERGCRVVNLSLGSSDSSPIEERFFQEMADRGVLVVAAAGNDGTGVPIEFPAGYSSVVAVGSVDRRNAHSDFSNTGPGLALSAPGDSILSAVPRGLGSEASVRARSSFRGDAMEFASHTSGTSGKLVDCGDGNSAEAFPASVRGQVALIKRGVEFFSVKVQNAMNAGAVAAVIYNNAAGDFSGTLQNPTAANEEPWIPAISVSDSAGRSLLKETGSRATVVNDTSDWSSGSGTSFAAPHVAGAAALVLALNRSLSRDQLLGILERTATPLGGGVNATFGHGLLNVESAARQAGSGAPAGGPCKSGRNVLCLLDRRFRVEVSWQNQFDGSSGQGVALPQSPVSGFFSFGNPQNIELLVKMLDFGGVIKLFYGQLTNLHFTMTVTDTRTGETQTYRNTTGDCGAIDQDAFPSAVAAAPGLLAAPAVSAAASSCKTGGNRLCLLNGRFEVSVDWANPGNGTAGQGGAVGLSQLTGAFYFTDRSNLELLTKMIDFGDRVAFFYGTLSDLEYTITVTDRSSGEERQYHNAAGNFCGGLDDPAF